MQAVLPRLHNKAAVRPGHLPVQRRQWIPRRKGLRHQPYPGQQSPRLSGSGAAAQHQRNQLVGCQVQDIGGRVGKIVGIAGKVEPRHIQPLLVGGLGVQGGVLCHTGHADQSMVVGQRCPVVKDEGMVPGGDDHLLPKMVFQVQVAAKQTAVPKGNACTHNGPSLWVGFSFSIPIRRGGGNPCTKKLQIPLTNGRMERTIHIKKF